jgi:tripartite-type tricarboxylate transporter receptor subunit TctC
MISHHASMEELDMTVKTILFALTAPVIALLCAAPISALAQGDYPVRPIRVLIPFPPGGAADLIGRTIGEKISAQLHQPVVMDNRPGAGGVLATDLLAKAEPDGYTLMVGMAGPIVISPSLNKHLSYSVERDLAPVTRVSEVLNVMVVNAASGVANVKDFIAWANKRAGDVRFGSSGPGQPDHLAGEFFKRLTGVDMTHVPYKGGAPALVDLVSGQIQLTFSTYIVAQPHIKSGRLRALAVITPDRQPLVPDLPTVAESVPGFGLNNWNGIFAPARTPQNVLQRLFTEINRALKAPDLKERQNAAGIEVVGSASIDDFRRFVHNDAARWGKIIKDAKIELE